MKRSKMMLLAMVTILSGTVWGYTRTLTAPMAIAATAARPSPTDTSSSLAQVIEGAKKEKQVFIHMNTSPQGRERLKKEIKSKYGVDLEIETVSFQSYPVEVAKATAEQNAGTTPPVDLMLLSDGDLVQAIAADLAEKIDWRPLLPAGTASGAILFDGHAVVDHTGHIGMIYNPKVIAAADAPKSLKDLANPKWRGKIAAYNYAINYLSYAFIRGVEPTLSDLRAMMKNQPALGTYSQIATRYMVGEYPIALISSSGANEIRIRKLPMEWVSLGVSFYSMHGHIVRKKAAHPNAAKLVAAYLAGPEGYKFILEVLDQGNMLYPGNFEHDIHQRDAKAGFPVYNPALSPGAADFIRSDNGKKTGEAIGRILRGE